MPGEIKTQRERERESERERERERAVKDVRSEERGVEL